MKNQCDITRENSSLKMEGTCDGTGSNLQVNFSYIQVTNSTPLLLLSLKFI